MTDADAIRDAASVILLRRSRDAAPAVLMGMRGAGAAFMPSKFVFPGGAVDPGDAGGGGDPDPLLSIEPRPGGCDPAALTVCARRELLEETGLQLPPTAPLHLVFRAITPPGRPRRFDARFFIADAADLTGAFDDFSAADCELRHLAWVPLAEATRLDLPFITEVVLAEAAACAAVEGPLQPAASVPFFDNRGAVPRFAWLSR